MKFRNLYKKISAGFLATAIVVSLFAVGISGAQAAINKEINYQGKLTGASNVAVADGTYAMEFKLYTQLSGGSPIWTETLTGSNEVQVTNGLFSVMLGSTTPFTGVNFNQTLYLGVNIESDGEMSPRKIIGAVPAAFVADTIDNLSSEQFLRSDAQNATSSSSTFLNILQTGAGKVAEFFGSASQTVLAILSNGNVGIGTSTPYAKLSVAGEVVASNFTATSTTATSTFAGDLMVGDYLSKRIIQSGRAFIGQFLSPINTLDVGAHGSDNGSLVVGTDFGGIVLAPSDGIMSQNFLGIGASTVANSLDVGAYDFGGGSYIRNAGAAIGKAYAGLITAPDDSLIVQGMIGVGTSSPYAKLSVAGQVVGSYFTGTTTATSTFGGNLAINGTGTTTSNGGFNIGAGCFAVNGACVGVSNYGDTNVNAFIHASTTIPKTYTANTFTALQTFGNASSTSMTVSGLLYNTSLTSGRLTYAGADGRLIDTGDMTFNGTQLQLNADSNNGALKFRNENNTSNSGYIGVSGSTNQIVAGSAQGDFALRAEANLFLSATGNSDFVVNQTTGYVGLGTNVASRRLTLNGTDEYIAFSASNVEKWLVGNEGASSDRFSIYNPTIAGYAFNIDNSTNNVGLGSTTPGTRLSIGNTGNSTINISPTATSTFGFGINLRAGCFAVNNSCMTIGSGTAGQVPYYPGIGSALAATSSLFIATTGNIGIGTTSPYAKLSVAGEIVGANFTATTTATSTFGGNLSINGTGTTTSAGGFNLSAGCFAIAGTCLASYSNSLVNSYIHASTTIPKTYTANTFTALQGFNSGILSLASSTIGNGTAAGGLTISGDATTTGNAYIAGNLGVGINDSSSLVHFRGAGNDLFRFENTSTNLADKVSVLFEGALSTPDTTPNFSTVGLNHTIGIRQNTADPGNFATVTFYDALGGDAAYFGTRFNNHNGFSNANSDFFIATANDSAPDIHFLIASTGNVGIGTTSPYAKLSVVGQVVAPYFTATSTTDVNTFNGLIQAFNAIQTQQMNPIDGDSLWTLQSGDGGTFLGTSGGMELDASSVYIHSDVDMTINPTSALGGSNLYIGSSTNGSSANWNRIGVSTSSPWGFFSIVGSENNVNNPTFVIASSTKQTQFLVNPNGNVGIGTTSPWRTLSVNGSSDLGINALAGSFTATSTSVASTFPYASSTALTVSGTASTSVLRAGQIIQYGDGINGYISGNSFRSQFYQDPTGAGPYIQFPNGSGNLEINGRGGTSGDVVRIRPNSGQTGRALRVDNSSGTEIFSILASNGNVGIGTSTPYAKLSVVGEVVGSYFTATTTATSTFAGGFRAAGTAGLNVLSDGKVGVGTASPVAKLQVDFNNTDYTNTNGANSHIIMNNPNASGQNVLTSIINGTVMAKWRTDYTGNIAWVAGSTGAHAFYTGGDYGVGTNRFNIANDGVITTGSGTTLDDGSGYITAAGDVCENLTGHCLTELSDRRLKTDVQPLGSTLDRVLQLNPVTFKWNDLYLNDRPGMKNATSTKVGFIAQEVEQLFPDLITGDVANHEGYIGIDYSKFSAVLAEAIKETNVKIDLVASSTAPTDCPDGECLVPTINDLKNKYENLVQMSNLNLAKIEAQQAEIEALKEIAAATSTIVVATTTNEFVIATSTLESIASTTADTLASSAPSFIARVAGAVQEFIATTGEWVLSRITAQVALFDRVETKVAAISRGLEMKDQANGKTYCVSIKNGDWDKSEGACTDVVANDDEEPANDDDDDDVVTIPFVAQDDSSSDDQATTTDQVSDSGNDEDTASSTPETASGNDGESEEIQQPEGDTTASETPSESAPEESSGSDTSASNSDSSGSVDNS